MPLEPDAMATERKVGVKRVKTYALTLAGLVFLGLRVSDVGVECGVFLAGALVVSGALAVLGCFGVDAVFVLGVFARIG